MRHLTRNYGIKNGNISWECSLSNRLKLFEDKPNLSCITDNVNWSNSISWIKISKDRIAIYINGTGIVHYPCGLLTKNKITIYDRSLLSPSCHALGKEFHENVKYSNRVGEWRDGKETAPGQGWVKCNNHKKETPVGKRPSVYGSEYVEITPLIFDFKYNLISSNATKKDREYAKEWIDIKKERNNRRNRARYHNNKAVERVKNGIFKIDDIFILQNVSVRRLVIEHFGMDKVLSTLEWKELDEDVIGGRPYQLVDIKIPDNNDESGYRKGTYLRMTNPSTGEIHFEGVPNPIENRETEVPDWMLRRNLKEPTVKCALAWRDQDYNQIYDEPKVLT